MEHNMLGVHGTFGGLVQSEVMRTLLLTAVSPKALRQTVIQFKNAINSNGFVLLSWQKLVRFDR